MLEPLALALTLAPTLTLGPTFTFTLAPTLTLTLAPTLTLALALIPTLTLTMRVCDAHRPATPGYLIITPYRRVRDAYRRVCALGSHISFLDAQAWYLATSHPLPPLL